MIPIEILSAKAKANPAAAAVTPGATSTETAVHPIKPEDSTAQRAVNVSLSVLTAETLT